MTDVLQAAGPLDGRIVIDAANSFRRQQLSLRSLAGAFPRARWVRAFNSLPVNVMAGDNHREPPWVLFLSGDQQVKPVAAQLIRDAGFDPVDLGGIDDSQLQDRGSALWTFAVTRDEAAALVARIKSGDTAAADPLTAPFEKFRDHAPDDPAFFLGHLSRSVFEAGIWQVAQDKWDGIREAFHSFDPAQVAAMTPAEIAATENGPRVIRNKAKIRQLVADGPQPTQARPSLTDCKQIVISNVLDVIIRSRSEVAMPREQRRGRTIAMGKAELDAFLTEQRTCRVATASQAGPHLTPLWYVWDGTALWVYSVVRSQRWSDISRDRRVAVLVDAGEAYGELRGAELRGAAEVVGEVPRTGTPDARLAEPEQLYGRKYNGTGVMRHTGHKRLAAAGS